MPVDRGRALDVTATYTVPLVAAQPGIFDDAVVHSGTLIRASTTPVQAGEFIEIYCTGLGAYAQIARPANHDRHADGLLRLGRRYAFFRRSRARLPGLYQINVQVPAGLPPGTLPVDRDQRQHV